MSKLPNWTPEEREQLAQELIELHFGCHENPEAFETRLANEPALRELQAEVLSQAQVLEEAVHPAQPRLHLPEPAASPVTALADRRPRWWHLPLGRMTAAAAAGLLAVLGFLAFERIAAGRLDNYVSEHLHLTVSAPKAVPAGAPWSFTVQAKNLVGAPTDCRVKWQAFDDNNVVLAGNEVATVDGNVTVALAANLAVPKRVEVVAVNSVDEVRQVFDLSTAYAGPLVHVSTDRPVYRPGETVRVRTVVLDRVTRLPLKRATNMTAQLLDAKGAPIGNDNDYLAPAGVGSFSLTVPRSSAGGTHKVKIASVNGLFADQTAEITVRSFRNPQLKKDIVLDRKSYAPGARGAAQVTALRLGDNSPTSGGQARGALIIDGKEVWHEERNLGANGSTTFRFQIPKDVDRGAARFVARITDGGVIESEVEPFVVPTGKVEVIAYPEGGELIAGVENGLYLECFDTLGRPIDGAGEIVDDRERRIATFRTAHQGRARLSFVPEKNARYKVRLHGKQQTFDLPTVRNVGIAIRLLGDDIAAGAPMRMAVAGRGNGPWLLGVFCRGVLVGQTTVRATGNGQLQTTSEVELPDTASGVLRATVFDRDLKPIAERLIRRHTNNRLEVELWTKSAVLSPGDRQTVKVKTMDENGKYTPAIVGLSCTDMAATSMGSEPRVSLADHAMLFGDVQQLEDLGDFFLGNDASGRNVDLLLGTRGWRRFVWRNDAAAQQAIVDAGDAGTGILTREGFSQTPQVVSNLKAANAPVRDLSNRQYWAKERLSIVLAIAISLLILVILAEGIAKLLKSGAFAQNPALRGFTSLATASLLLVIAGMVIGGGQLADSAPATMTVEMAPSSDASDFKGVSQFEQLTSGPINGAPHPGLLYWGAFDDARKNWDFSALDLNGFGQGNSRFTIVSSEAQETANEKSTDLDNAVAELDPARSFLDDEQPALFLLPELQSSSFGWFAYVGPSANTPASPEAWQQALAGYQPLWRQRQYAHVHQASEDRRDFTATVMWNTLVVTDGKGDGSVSFDTSDAVTTWTVEADAHVATGDIGRLGYGSREFTTQLPLQIEPKLPDEVSAGDRLLIPISAILKDAKIAEITLAARVGNGLTIGANAPEKIQLDNTNSDAGRGRVLLPIEVGQQVGDATIEIIARAGRFVDRVRHVIKIAPRGFPHHRSAGGQLTNAEPGSWKLVVPGDTIEGSGHVTLKVYPSPIAALTEGLEGILREPHGCFEQASSSNYPNTLVLNLIEANGDDIPMVAARARQLLPKGYAKITGYECTQKGYEWFGSDPGHEALTAYGLLQFVDMAKVYDVDMEMVDRTKQWLLNRRDGKGNYPHPKQDHHSFGGRSPSITSAYVTYALLQAGTSADTLKTEIDALVKRIDIDDPYELALIACALGLTERPEASRARRRLTTLQAADGSLPGAKSSITMSGGRDLLVEATGFAVLAWLPEGSYAGNVRKAVQYLQSSRNGRGTFGATQATIVALRAISAYATANRSMRKDGTLFVYEGDRLLAKHPFAADDVAAMQFDLWHDLEPGEHTLRIQVEGGGDTPMPWAGEVSYHAEVPADDPDTATSITATLRQAQVQEGQTVALDVVIENVTDNELPTPMAIIGLPAGLELPTSVIEDLHKAEKFSYWELQGRELILYWRKMDAGEKHELTLDLVARVPGTSSGPASRTYLYYTPEQKRWSEPLRVAVTPAK
mgnify:FL=1|tara:strand:- start:124147 stop:129237 length:5091 start_codon:yes stop_codon:yes gene_type:complete